MRRLDRAAHTADRSVSHFSNGVDSAIRAGWDLAFGIEFDVGRQIIRITNRVSIFSPVLQRILIDGGIQLAQVVDAGIRA